jgi:MATE family multidrug resistance protein
VHAGVVSRPPEVSHRRVLAIAAPMTLSHATTPLLGFVDAAVIGRLGEAHLLGAIALGAVIFDVLFWTFGALRMATAGLTAQAVGAGDAREVDRTLARALLAAALIGLALVVLQAPVAAAAFRLAGASEAVTEALLAYFAVRIWAAPLTLANYVILGSTLGRGRTDLGLLLQLAVNVINIALTAALVLGFGMGVEGAALGTVAAEAVGVGLGVLVLRRLGSNPFRVSAAEALERAALVRALVVNRDIMIRTVALSLAFAIFASRGARAGDVTLAANAVLLNMFMIGGYVLDGFATAAEALCGQALGARHAGAFRRAARLCVGWSLGFGAAIALVFYAGGGPFIDAVSTNPEVRILARDYLLFAAVTPLVGAPAFAFDGIFIGATWTRAMRDLMLAAFAAFALLAFTATDLGNAGLWTAFLVFLGARGIGQAALYPRLARGAFGG